MTLKNRFVSHRKVTHRKVTHRKATSLGGAAMAAALVLSAYAGPGAQLTSASAAQALKGRVFVFGAASLNGAFTQIGKQFHKAHPDVNVKFNFAGSSTLAEQITQGAPATVFASASTKDMEPVTKAKLNEGKPKIFVRNRLEIMVAKGNPEHIKTVNDLANPDIKVSVCAADVPCGAYSTEIFDKANIKVKPVSMETSVTGVVTRVTTGEADAGIVYVTDVLAGGPKVEGVKIPDKSNVIAEYPIANLKGANPASKEFTKYVRSPAGEKVLAEFGFIIPAG